MRGVNKVVLVGSLGANPESKSFPNGVTHLEVVNGIYFRIREWQGIIKVEFSSFKATWLCFASINNIFHFVDQDACFGWHVLNAWVLIKNSMQT